MKYILLALLFVGCSTATEPESDKWVYHGKAMTEDEKTVLCDDVTVTIQIVKNRAYGEVRGSCIWDSIQWSEYVDGFADIIEDRYPVYWHVPNGKKKSAQWRLAIGFIDSLWFLSDSISVKAYR